MANVGRQVFGAGAIVLGAIGVVSRDFALVWQPVPESLPARTVLAVVTGLALVVGGVLVCSRRRVALGGIVLSAVYGLGVLLLHAPRVLAHPEAISPWGGLAEHLALLCGAFIVFATFAPNEAESRRRLIRAGVVTFAVCLLVFGLVHFRYVAETAAMVPAWLPPGGIFWAYATGIGHIAAGVALLLGIWTRLATRLLVLMFLAFAVFVHAPLLWTDPHTHLNWVMNAINLCLTGAAWVVMDSTASPS
jgi:uncharacterized membrane protein YphA (DoxX/SURF4 family)